MALMVTVAVVTGGAGGTGAYAASSVAGHEEHAVLDPYLGYRTRNVADRTRAVAPRTRVIQRRVVYVNRSGGYGRAAYGAYGDRTSVRVVRNPAYHSPTVVVVEADVAEDIRETARDGGDGNVVFYQPYVTGRRYVGYSRYSVYGNYGSYGSYGYGHHRTYPVYRYYPSRHGYGHGYGYGYGRGHGYGHGYGGHYGGRYGHHYGGHHSRWGVSIHFSF